MSDAREMLKELGWKQGALIRSGGNYGFSKFSHLEISDNDLFIVVTQTCDLVNPSFESEPYFEALRIKPIDSSEKEYLGGKNSRLLHMDLSSDSGIDSYLALPFEKIYVDRRLLLKQSPENHLDEENLDIVISWLIKRIGRTAFPDSFDQRWKVRQRQIERVIKRLVLVEDIYLKIVPFTELDSADKYTIELHLLINAENFDNEEVFTQYKKHIQDLEDQFCQCPNIEIEVIELRSTAEITINEIQEMDRWDYSYLSFRNPEVHASASSQLL